MLNFLINKKVDPALLDRPLPRKPQQVCDTIPHQAAPPPPKEKVQNIFVQSERSNFGNTIASKQEKIISNSQASKKVDIFKTISKPKMATTNQPVLTGSDEYLNIHQSSDYLNEFEKFKPPASLKKIAIVQPTVNADCSKIQGKPELEEPAANKLTQPVTSVSVGNLKSKFDNVETTTPSKWSNQHNKKLMKIIENIGCGQAIEANKSWQKTDPPATPSFKPGNQPKTKTPPTPLTKNIAITKPFTSLAPPANFPKATIFKTNPIHDPKPISKKEEIYYCASEMIKNTDNNISSPSINHNIKARLKNDRNQSRALSFGVHSWDCDVCKSHNGFEHLKCSGCFRVRNDVWRCDRCDRIYSNDHNSCIECSTKRPQNPDKCLVCKNCDRKNSSYRRF